MRGVWKKSVAESSDRKYDFQPTIYIDEYSNVANPDPRSGAFLPQGSG
jgi:hypothetical protein